MLPSNMKYYSKITKLQNKPIKHYNAFSHYTQAPVNEEALLVSCADGIITHIFFRMPQKPPFLISSYRTSAISVFSSSIKAASFASLTSDNVNRRSLL